MVCSRTQQTGGIGYNSVVLSCYHGYNSVVLSCYHGYNSVVWSNCCVVPGCRWIFWAHSQRGRSSHIRFIFYLKSKSSI